MVWRTFCLLNDDNTGERAWWASAWRAHVGIGTPLHLQSVRQMFRGVLICSVSWAFEDKQTKRLCKSHACDVALPTCLLPAAQRDLSSSHQAMVSASAAKSSMT